MIAFVMTTITTRSKKVQLLLTNIGDSSASTLQFSKKQLSFYVYVCKPYLTACYKKEGIQSVNICYNRIAQGRKYLDLLIS